MNWNRHKKWPALAMALAAGFIATAQNNGVPGPTDYPSFSRFITDRNIFDPNRVPHSPSAPRNYRIMAHVVPTFSLVGTMSYSKGLFAFFDGTDPDLRKVLAQSGNIAGYTVTKITPEGVELQSADKSRVVELKVGDMMRQENQGDWQFAGHGELASNESSNEASVSSGSAASNSPDPAPSSGPASDVLKKLMEQRAQELK